MLLAQHLGADEEQGKLTFLDFSLPGFSLEVGDDLGIEGRGVARPGRRLEEQGIPAKCKNQKEDDSTRSEHAGILLGVSRVSASEPSLSPEPSACETFVLVAHSNCRDQPAMTKPNEIFD